MSVRFKKLMKEHFLNRIGVSRLSISDETILGSFPNKEDFLLPDLKVAELPMWDENIQFNQITIPTQGN